MQDTDVLRIATDAIAVAAQLSVPILGVSLAVGVVISLVQTVTQVQEATLTFVPKLVAVAVILLVGGNWMIRELVGFVTRLWSSIPALMG